MVISLSLNDSAHNILNDILKIYGLVGSLLFNGFSVFDGFLVSVILSSVVSPTGGMVTCFSSSQVSILHLQKDVLILFSFGCFFDRVLSCFCHTFDCFQHVVSLWFKSFHKKDLCHLATASIVLLTDLLFSLFWGAYITPFWWVLLFQNSAVIHKVAQCVIPMQIRYILIYFIHHIRTGPLHMFKLFSSWICMSRQPHQVTSGQSQSQFLHTSSKRKEPKHKQKAGSLFYTEHNQ